MGLTRDLCVIMHDTNGTALGAACVGRALPPEQRDELLDALDCLEQQDAAGVAKIVALLAAARVTQSSDH